MELSTIETINLRASEFFITRVVQAEMVVTS